MDTIRGAKVHEKKCEVYLSTPPVGYSGSPSTVNEINCNKKKISFKKSYEIISNSCSTTMCLKRDAIDCVVLDGCVDDFFIETAARKSDRSFIGPFLPD